MYRQTFSSIKALAHSFCTKTGLNCEIFKIKTRMIYSFSKTVKEEQVLELFDIIITFFLQLIGSEDVFYAQDIRLEAIQYIEKFLESYTF
jgi:hypothetical protein